MHINRFLGRSVHFANGFGLGFNWVHGNGETTKTSAILASYSPPWSLTWGWALYWDRPQRPTNGASSMTEKFYVPVQGTAPRRLIDDSDFGWTG